MADFLPKFQDRRIDSKYSLVRKIGEGGYGAVYLGMCAVDPLCFPLSDHSKDRISVTLCGL